MRCSLRLLFAAALVPAMLIAEPIRVLILTGETDLPYHDWRITAPFLRGVLANTGRFSVKVEEEVRGITAATLAAYDVLVLHYNGPRWGDATEQAMEQFLRAGKGMIAIHGVSYGPFYGQQMAPKRILFGEPWAAYAEMLGSHWKLENIGHARRHVFTVNWVVRDHPISCILPQSFVANDELYHKMDLHPGSRVIATAYNDPKLGGTGKDEPIIWTTAFGKGRVIHLTLGHDLQAMSQPGFVQAFTRGTEWAATATVAP